VVSEILDSVLEGTEYKPLGHIFRGQDLLQKLKDAKYVFQKEFDEYIANGSLGPQRPTWDPDGRASIPYHYSRLLALTVAIEFASGESSTAVAKAIRDEANGLCESYFRWCDHILGVWGGQVHRSGS